MENINIEIRFDLEKEIKIGKEKVEKLALDILPEVINKAKINKNVIKWLNGEEIKDVIVKIWNATIFTYDYRIVYWINDKITAEPIIASGNSLTYKKISFAKKRF